MVGVIVKPLKPQQEKPERQPAEQLSFYDDSPQSPKESPEESPEEFLKESSQSPESLTAEVFPDGGRKAYMATFGCFLCLTATIGITNGNGAIENYIADNMLPDALPSNLSWIFASFNLCTFGAVLFLGPLYNLIGAKAMLLASFLFMVVGMMCFSVCKELYQFILSYVVCGIGVSLSFTAAISTVTHWFYKHRSFATGVSLIGGCLGGILVPVALRPLFQEVGFGWAIRILGFLSLTLIALAFLLVSDRRAELGISSSHLITKSLVLAVKGVDFSHFLEPGYATLVFGLTGNSGPFFVTMNYIVSYATVNGWPASEAYNIPIVLNATAIVGRSAGGWASDRYGRFNVFILMNLLSCVAIFGCWLPPSIGHTKAGLYAFSVIFGLTSGSYFQSSPTCVAQISTTETFASRFGTASFLIALLNFAFLPIGGAIIGTESNKQGYDNLAVFVGALQATGLVLSCVSRYIYAGFRPTVV